MKNMTYFQAANLSDSEIKSQFVVRKKEFELVMSEIKRDDMSGSIQHYIFIGQRGSGKSTLLRRITAEINTDPGLYDRIVAVNLGEEQAATYRLHDLWIQVIDELRVKGFAVEDVNWKQFGKDLTAYSKALYGSIQKTLKAGNKKIVLLLDNIDRVLQNIKLEDNKLFRELLMNYKDVRIIGGSTKLSEHHWKYDEPFYEFFRIIRLEALSQEELKELLLSWSECMNEPSLKTFIEKHAGKLNAIRILSDGMPRTMLNLLELLINKPEEKGYEYLKAIVDNATPIYQERLTTLSPLQQKVLLDLSFFWDAVKVNELSEALRMESKLVSSVLKQLVDLKIVEKRKGKGKNLYYLLHERFFNLWLIMTQGGPHQKSQVKWLTIFLETWYEAEELKEAYKKFSQELEEGKLTADHATLMASAFIHSKVITVNERDFLLKNLKEQLSENHEYLAYLPKMAIDIFIESIQLLKKEKFQEALVHVNKVEQSDEFMDMIRGFAYEGLGRPKEALKHLLLAQNIKDKGRINLLIGRIKLSTGNLQVGEKHLKIAFDKGNIRAGLELAVSYYVGNKNKEKAIEYFQIYIDKVSQPTKGLLLGIIMKAWIGEFEEMRNSYPLVVKAISKKDLDALDFCFAELLVHHQKNTVWHWFHDEEIGNELRDMLKPVYFATARLINSEKTNEALLSQPPELSEPVNSILIYIKERQAFYYGKSD